MKHTTTLTETEAKELLQTFGFTLETKKDSDIFTVTCNANNHTGNYERKKRICDADVLLSIMAYLRFNPSP